MKISVITVTYNALEGLRKTVETVVSQRFADYEYIVVDGGGQDGTADYLASEAKGITRWVSEPDGGIYEAMNKGVGMAKGEYCIFMNAGDLLVNDQVLSRVCPYLDGTDIVLGNELLVNQQGRIIGLTPSRGAFTLRHLFTSSVCHQATFIRRSILLEHPYDESFRLVSDWKFILERFLDDTTSFKTIDIDICLFHQGGATDTFVELGAAEKRAVLNDYPQYRYLWESQPSRPFLPRVWYHLRMMIKRFRLNHKR